MWHLTYDSWNATHDMRQVTRNTWHMTCDIWQKKGPTFITFFVIGATIRTHWEFQRILYAGFFRKFFGRWTIVSGMKICFLLSINIVKIFSGLLYVWIVSFWIFKVGGEVPNLGTCPKFFCSSSVLLLSFCDTIIHFVLQLTLKHITVLSPKMTELNFYQNLAEN